ncbi:MAG: hypothetical protein QXY05_02650 [Candidatus Anstonellales archaeon]
MTDLIEGQVYRVSDIPNFKELYRKMQIFPTPFRGIYYCPYKTEREAWYITDPHRILFDASRLYLNSEEYYFGLYTALYYLRIIWNPFGTDIINKKLSRVVEKKIPEASYWRAKKLKKILENYPSPVRFHRIKAFSFDGVLRKGRVAFSNLPKTKKDALYLCRKGNRVACEVLKLANAVR